ncbi:hypothetical protein RHMOL_Rhmol04G0163500 [Rhododendron molle]|uniref:Uncharacterized protein n=1 Tax=Rhododendron molle TaxID=49168 RepID=A0ACC0P145_RHOML|nr:hypothetical protein RHMOL_Rhmol04G0163500 [Rhododendron molle]
MRLLSVVKWLATSTPNAHWSRHLMNCSVLLPSKPISLCSLRTCHLMNCSVLLPCELEIIDRKALNISDEDRHFTLLCRD